MTRRRLLKVFVPCLVLVAGAALLAAGAPGCNKRSNRTTIAVIPKGTTHEFWKSVHAGANKAAKELDVDVIWKGPLKEDDRDSQINTVEDFITRGVSGIVLAPLDDTALQGPVANAGRAGIPVVIIDSGLKGATTSASSRPTTTRAAASPGNTWRSCWATRAGSCCCGTRWARPARPSGKRGSSTRSPSTRT